jgi:hypothetical protein
MTLPLGIESGESKAETSLTFVDANCCKDEEVTLKRLESEFGWLESHAGW